MTCENYPRILEWASWLVIFANLMGMYLNYRTRKKFKALSQEQDEMTKACRVHLDYCQDLRNKYEEKYDKQDLIL